MEYVILVLHTGSSNSWFYHGMCRPKFKRILGLPHVASPCFMMVAATKQQVLKTLVPVMKRMLEELPTLW